MSKLRDHQPLADSEIQELTRKSDLRGWWAVGVQVAFTGLIFVAMAVWTNPLTLLLGVILLGGRHLGFFVLTHEAGHRSLFRTQKYNAWVADWLCAPMDFSNPRAYMREHLQHHQAMGTHEDPDLQNYHDYPITRARLGRKLKRDLTGQTGWRNLKAKLSQFGHWSTLTEEHRDALRRGVVWHAVLLVILTPFNVSWLFLVWVAAQIFAYPAIVRLRQVAEHAAVPQLFSDDPRANTRTTLSNPLMRLLLCPHGVNYHIEHHLLASVPIYRLRNMHQKLRNVGYYDDVEIAPGYWAVLKPSSSVSYATG